MQFRRYKIKNYRNKKAQSEAPKAPQKPARYLDDVPPASDWRWGATSIIANDATADFAFATSRNQVDVIPLGLYRKGKVTTRREIYSSN